MSDVPHKDECRFGLRNDHTANYFQMAVYSVAFLDLEMLPLHFGEAVRRFCANKYTDSANNCTSKESVVRIDAKAAVVTCFVCMVVPAIMIDVSIQLG